MREVSCDKTAFTGGESAGFVEEHDVDAARPERLGDREVEPVAGDHGLGPVGGGSGGAAGDVTGALSCNQVILSKTITAGGTTGAQTINKPIGSVNLAAAATSLVVTSSVVGTAANTIVLLTVGSNDTTCKSCAVVVGTGQFTIYPDAAPTAETVVFFQIIRVL